MARCRKIRYRDEISAKLALASARNAADRKGWQGEARKEARAYRCPKCKGWHLTSQEASSGTPGSVDAARAGDRHLGPDLGTLRDEREMG